MNNTRAKITYLAHSGFAVETARHFLVFDYYQSRSAASRTIADGVITADYLKTKSNIYVFASHNHSDHFDPMILDWGKTNPAITYILSDDISIPATKGKIHFMQAYETVGAGQLTIKSYGSTDQGISFLVQADGLAIFHAGDLNWWHWKNETPKEQAWAESFFKSEIDKIPPQNIDIAFFPVDPRLEEFYCIGAEYFAAKFSPRLLIPMHFWSNYAAIGEFAEKK